MSAVFQKIAQGGVSRESPKGVAEWTVVIALSSNGNSKELLIRMKRLSLLAFWLLAFCLISVSAMVAAGQTSTASRTATPPVEKSDSSTVPTAKVAVIAFQAAVTQTNEFQRDLDDLQKKYDPRRTEIKNLSDQVDTLTKQLQADSAKLSDAERESRTRTIENKKRQLDRETQDAQSDFQADIQQSISSVAQKVGALMTDYAEKRGYTLVLDTGNQQSQTVLYAIPITDITRAVIEAYNQKSGIPAPTPQAAGEPDAPQPQPQQEPAH